MKFDLPDQFSISDEFEKSIISAYIAFENPVRCSPPKEATFIGGNLAIMKVGEAETMKRRRYYMTPYLVGASVNELCYGDRGAKILRQILSKGRVDVAVANGVAEGGGSILDKAVDLIAASVSLEASPPSSLVLPRGGLCIRLASLSSANLAVRTPPQGWLPMDPWKTHGAVDWFSVPIGASLNEAKANQYSWKESKHSGLIGPTLAGCKPEVVRRVRRQREGLVWLLQWLSIHLYDRRERWLLGTDAGSAGIDFGAHHEHVKSLLYARTLPVTASGRKRPILHLVDAHRRRMKNGIEINIAEHLRGLKEVQLGDSRVTIKPPEVVEERIADAKAEKKLAKVGR